MQGNKRLPGDLLGRWQRLNAELEAKAEDLHYGGIHVDWSDMAVLNAFLTEETMDTGEAVDPRWPDDVMLTRYRAAFDENPDVYLWGFLCWLRDDMDALQATIATQAARIDDLKGDLELTQGMLEQVRKESDMIFDRGAHRLARIKALEADNERLRAELEAANATILGYRNMVVEQLMRVGRDE